jgi:hypothetical protein
VVSTRTGPPDGHTVVFPQFPPLSSWRPSGSAEAARQGWLDPAQCAPGWVHQGAWISPPTCRHYVCTSQTHLQAPPP